MTFSELANLLNKRSKENAHATRSTTKRRTAKSKKERKSQVNV